MSCRLCGAHAPRPCGVCVRCQLRFRAVVGHPAAASLTPFMESASAHRMCRHCDIDSRAEDFSQPYSFFFLRGCAGKG
eukprot:scaffold25729_cov185-Isochrysis_galbana.AAC.1